MGLLFAKSVGTPISADFFNSSWTHTYYFLRLLMILITQHYLIQVIIFVDFKLMYPLD